MVGPLPERPIQLVWGWTPEFCCFNEFPGNADAADLWTTLWWPLVMWKFKFSFNLGWLGDHIAGADRLFASFWLPLWGLGRREEESAFILMTGLLSAVRSVGTLPFLLARPASAGEGHSVLMEQLPSLLPLPPNQESARTCRFRSSRVCSWSRSLLHKREDVTWMFRAFQTRMVYWDLPLGGS